MENASKALIIAGAILISILLISIGVMLINSGREVTDTGTASMGGYKIEAFNSKFTMYEGTKKGSEIKNIFSTMHANNQTDEHKVEIAGVSSAADIKITGDYKVTLGYENGYVKTITITEITGAGAGAGGNVVGNSI